MNDKELKEYLLSEEQKTFQGWDFSYLDGRWIDEELPWDYRELINKYVKESDNILDIGTGGGEFILSLKRDPLKTSVTEAYGPNIELCQKTLLPLGYKVYPLTGDDKLYNIPDDYFDCVIDRHESFDVLEVKRVLKNNGLFITQQVGALNNDELARFIDSLHLTQFPHMTLPNIKTDLTARGFKILEGSEYYPYLRFFDIGAFTYFAKIINWEFLDFSVEHDFKKLKELKKIIDDKGYIESREHRFYVVAKNQK